MNPMSRSTTPGSTGSFTCAIPESLSTAKAVLLQLCSSLALMCQRPHLFPVGGHHLCECRVHLPLSCRGQGQACRQQTAACNTCSTRTFVLVVEQGAGEELHMCSIRRRSGPDASSWMTCFEGSFSAWQRADVRLGHTDRGFACWKGAAANATRLVKARCCSKANDTYVAAMIHTDSVH